MTMFALSNDDGSMPYPYTEIIRWSVPEGERAGEWVSFESVGSVFRNACSLYRIDDILIHTLTLPALWVAEGRGDEIAGAHRSFFPEARLIRRVAAWTHRFQRELSCDLAEHVLSIFQADRSDDGGIRDAIEVSRMFARGESSVADLEAAREIVRVRSRLAMDRSQASSAVWLAAWEAIRESPGAAGEVAHFALMAVEDRASEREWQNRRMIELLGLDA